MPNTHLFHLYSAIDMSTLVVAVVLTAWWHIFSWLMTMFQMNFFLKRKQTHCLIENYKCTRNWLYDQLRDEISSFRLHYIYKWKIKWRLLMLYTLLKQEITQKLTKIINLLNKCDRKTLKLLFIFSCPYNNLKNVFFPFLFFLVNIHNSTSRTSIYFSFEKLFTFSSDRL